MEFSLAFLVLKRGFHYEREHVSLYVPLCSHGVSKNTLQRRMFRRLRIGKILERISHNEIVLKKVNLSL
jgi:hypothetical protein